MTEQSVCVVVAAWNAAATIGRAVASALAEPEVAEVRVVDDASCDDTAAAARAGDDGSGRLIVTTLAANGGPSRARNLAIAATGVPYVAILDADDLFLPGRFAALLAERDWDLAADNIVFVADPAAALADREAIAAHRIAPRTLSAAAFVEGSISRRGRYKHELGFLKPVMARAFLETHRLRYAEAMRLSEDYDLYARALIAGARFRLAGTCHYVAVERADSLSSRHDERDLAAVDRALAALRPHAGDDRALAAALRRHHAQVARKRRHRALLATKRERGLGRALADLAGEPRHLMAALADVARDKLPSRPKPAEALRFLL